MKKKLLIALIAITAAICGILGFAACGGDDYNGTYYRVTGDGEINKHTYIVLDSGKWKNEDDDGGTYEIKGETIIFTEEFLGEVDKTEGTFENYVIFISGQGRYISEKHKHAYGEWETETELSCTVDGVEVRKCSCGMRDSKITKCVGHHTGGDWHYDFYKHYKICTVCENHYDENSHSGTATCKDCSFPLVDTNGLQFSLNENQNSYKVTGLGNATGDIIRIPSTYNNLPVTSIGTEAFSGCTTLASIFIPNSVTSIGIYAFVGCNKLQQTENGITYVDKWAIDCDTSITEVILRSDTKGIAIRAFEQCSNLTSITIPDSVTHINNGAFYDCPLKNVTLGSGVAFIGSQAFRYEYIDNFEVSIDNTKYCSKDNCLIDMGSKTVIAGCKNCTIPNDSSVTSIGENAFESSSWLKELIIPDNITSIGSNAFANCDNLTSVIIGKSVTSIGYGAFGGCNLTTATIPVSVTFIGDFAFGIILGEEPPMDINYGGTKEQWSSIKKSHLWNDAARNYTIHCTDGDIEKA